MSFRYRSILLALLLPLFMAGAAEPEFRMTYSVFFPATHVPTQLAREWAAEVEKRSEGRLVIDVYPGGILSGAGENYECVVKGVSDLGMSCFSYSRGMFPMMEGLDLPLGYQDGRQATRVANAYVRTFELPELADTRLLYVHAHGPGVLAARRPVTSVKELEGLSVRGTGISALIIRALGCNAIGMGQPDTYEALRKGVVDATLCPVETLKGWRQGEVISDVVKIPSAGYTTAMFVVMNRGSWSRLPADLRQILLEVSDEWIPKHGAAWNEADGAAEEFVTGLGKKISAFSPEADAAAAQR
ncbi:MAG: TRAP transporter substrate-binding protein, partial [Victivallales bacterium]|nr:TRAP transporter substrate-binding protein [Victivallales bacterium]